MSSGTITTVAGNGNAGYSGDSGSATSAELDSPVALAVDGSGNVFVAELNNQVVREFVIGGDITTYAGNRSTTFAGDNGPATSAYLSAPLAAAPEPSGNLSIGDSGNIRMRDVAAGVITTKFTNSQLTAPRALAVAPNGDVYVAMGGGSIQVAQTAGLVRKISGNTISTVAGLLVSNDPYGDCGLAVNATMDNPQGIAVDTNGDVYVSETADNVIRMITPAGVIETVAGSRDGTEGFSGDNGPATSALLSQPTGLALAPNGDLIFADAGNNRIRKITKSGTITTIAGDGFPGYDGDDGPPLSAEFRGMRGLAVDSAGDIFVADTLNNRVREISGGTVSTVVGSGTFGFSGDGAAASDAELAHPSDVHLDAAGNLYIADTNNDRVPRGRRSALCRRTAGERPDPQRLQFLPTEPEEHAGPPAQPVGHRRSGRYGVGQLRATGDRSHGVVRGVRHGLGPHVQLAQRRDRRARYRLDDLVLRHDRRQR